MTAVYRAEDASDQLDIAKYATIVGQRWKLMVGIVVLAILVAAAATVVLTRVAPQYSSTVTILLTGPRYRINFDPKFANNDAVSAPTAARVDEYRAIANSPEVQLATVQALSSQLAPEEVARIPVAALVRGQLITVTATANDPDKASLVGAAYAKATADRLDAVYGQTDQNRQAIANKLAESITAHEQAQAHLTDFLRTSQIDALSVQIAQKEAVMQSLAEERASFVKNRLSSYYAALAETDQIVRSASSLHTQVQAAAGTSTPAVGASLALVTLQSRLASLGSQTDEAHVDLSRGVRTTSEPTERAPNAVFSPRAVAPPQLQLQLNADALARADADPQALLRSIDSLVTSATAQHDDAQRAIDTLSQQVARGGATQEGSSLDATIAQLAKDLSTLQASYRQQTFQQSVLTQNVEQVRSTRATLEAKLSEANVTAEAGGGGAIVAAGTNAPEVQSWPPPLSRSLPLALAAGLVIGVIVVLIVGLGWSSPTAPAHPVVESATPSPAVR